MILDLPNLFMQVYKNGELHSEGLRVRFKVTHSQQLLGWLIHSVNLIFLLRQMNLSSPDH